MKQHFILTPKGLLPHEAGAAFIAEINGAGARTIFNFYQEMSDAFLFPDYFEGNLDSLDEMLNDLAWIDFTDVVLHVSNAAQLLADEDEEQRDVVLGLLDDVAEEWRSRASNFSIIMERSDEVKQMLDDTGIPYSEVLA